MEGQNDKGKEGKKKWETELTMGLALRANPICKGTWKSCAAVKPGTLLNLFLELQLSREVEDNAEEVTEWANYGSPLNPYTFQLSILFLL